MLQTASAPNTIEVPVETLDAILEKEKEPVLLKIDVEGFETNVLKGGARTLPKETTEGHNNWVEWLGCKVRLWWKATSWDNWWPTVIHAYQYSPFERELTEIETFGTHNTIYIKGSGFCKERVKKAEKLKILDRWI